MITVVVVSNTMGNLRQVDSTKVTVKEGCSIETCIFS